MATNGFTKYIHKEDTHNLQSPGVIVPFIVEKFNPSSVADIGCGIGTFLHEFKANGVTDIVGLDGKWVDRKKLLISADEFIETDLELPIKLDKSFDLVLCLEVAEHLSEKSADTIINSLTGLSKTIIFSAATKLQGGQNHINEQPFSYWKKKFEAKGYIIIDFFRPVFWNEEKIQWWYKQNMFLIVHNSIDTKRFTENKKEFSEDNLLIHPELYYERIQEFENKCLELEKLRTGQRWEYQYVYRLIITKVGFKEKLIALHSVGDRNLFGY